MGSNDARSEATKARIAEIEARNAEREARAEAQKPPPRPAIRSHERKAESTVSEPRVSNPAPKPATGMAGAIIRGIIGGWNQ